MKRVLILFLVAMLVLGVAGCTTRGEPEGVNQNPSPPPDSGQPKETTNDKITVTLYFADTQAMYVVPETREITLNDEEKQSQEKLVKRILEELIAGPVSPSLHRTIPDGVTVNAVDIQGDIAYIDFSREMVANHWGGAAGEAMTINSIVNTLTELEGINKVMMTVDGGTMLIEHMVIEEPLERNESMIKP
ncbi:GerMN domain-containing protein [Calderihabitans maritimus]|uniref:Lipoprotein LpqB, GerMN domain-containing protein n=1 Tax=Calderihabitans maritimus TaxID=1246530 RepID=A0A1Z5HN80_9FIRM|nr:GerMN domain-containing protein [Calderihabitans maritimus]GAW90974.1 Lipoprotein LpqB, GerMN domain-containing protein [Calderihabitans maritimus]